MAGRPSTYDRIANTRFRFRPGVKASFSDPDPTARRPLEQEQRKNTSLDDHKLFQRADDCFHPLQYIPTHIARAPDAFQKRQALNPSKYTPGLCLLGHFSLLDSPADVTSLPALTYHRDAQSPVTWTPSVLLPVNGASKTLAFAQESTASSATVLEHQLGSAGNDVKSCPPIDLQKLTEVHISQPTTGLSYRNTARIIDTVHNEVVSPRNGELEEYPAWSSITYGEMKPPLLERIIHMTNVTPSSVVVDLGSGVGNVVLYLAVRTGCMAFGIECVQVRADIAREQLEKVKIMAGIWEGSMGPVELIQGDILTHPKVPEWIRKADLVLVNNFIFEGTLSLGIGELFRQLKEGAYVVSLASVGVSARGGKASARDEDALGAIMSASRHEYPPGSVSWSDSAGTFYVHVMKGNGQHQSM